MKSLITGSRQRVEASCPLRPGERCSLCQLDVTGPEDCGLVYLVMSDPELRADYAARAAKRHRQSIHGAAATPRTELASGGLVS